MFTIFAMSKTLFLFFGMVGMILLGLRIGRRRRDHTSETAAAGQGVLDGAVFALLGLIIAFTFSGAAGRFDERRNLIVMEANNIGTAWLRIDLLPDVAQPALRDLFRDYVDARLMAYRLLPDLAAADAELARATALQTEIWASVVATARSAEASPAVAMLMLPALNQMIDITTTRTMATQRHPPLAVWIMLFVLSLTAALLAGNAMAAARSPSYLHIVGFPAVMAVMVNFVIDLENPRLGLIRVDSFDTAIEAVRASMD